MSYATPQPEDLLSDLHFAQRIALHLVRDHHIADEVAQEAILAALERTDIEPSAKRAWLGGVVRNLSRNHGRDARRRREREARYLQDGLDQDRGGGAPEGPVAEALVRAEQKAKLVNHVMALREPYRTVIILRYMEELSPDAVAQELGRPLETVKTQTRRGMAQLREALDQGDGGDGTRWALALLPLLGKKDLVELATSAGIKGALPSVTPTAGPTGLAGAKVLGAGAAAVALAAVLVVSRKGPDLESVIERAEGVHSSTPAPAEEGAGAIGSDPVASVNAPMGRRGSPGLTLHGASSPRSNSENEDPEPTGLLGVHVQDGGTGNPVIGATVSLVLIPMDWASGVAEADPAGAADAAIPELLELQETMEQGLTPTLVVPLGGSLDQAVAMMDAPIPGGGWAMGDSEDSVVKAVTDANGEADLLWPDPAVPMKSQGEEGESKALGEFPAMGCVTVEADGYATLTHPVSMDAEGASPLVFELEPAARLRVSRGTLAPSASLAVWVASAVMGEHRVVFLEPGEDDALVPGLRPGGYRISCRALDAHGGSQETFEVRDRLVRVSDGETLDVVLRAEAPESLHVELGDSTGTTELDGLTLRVAGVHKGSRASVETSFDGGRAVVRGLHGPGVQVEVRKGGVVLAAGTVEVPAGSAEPVHFALELPEGELGLSLSGFTDAQSVAIVLAPSASPTESGSPVSSRSYRLTIAELREGVVLGHLPLGSYELWWGVLTNTGSQRVGRLQVEVGAGTPSASLDLSDNGLEAVELVICECLWCADGLELQTPAGVALPVDLGAEAMGELAEAPPRYSLELPRGDYVARFRSPELGLITEHISVGTDPVEVTLHAGDDAVHVSLRLPEAASGDELLIEALEHGEVGLGNVVVLSESREAVVHLVPGRYRVTDSEGRTAPFEVSTHNQQHVLTPR